MSSIFTGMIIQCSISCISVAYSLYFYQDGAKTTLLTFITPLHASVHIDIFICLSFSVRCFYIIENVQCILYFLLLNMQHVFQKKKIVEIVGKKKFVVEIDEKYGDQKKHQMVTYIIGEAYDNKFLQQNIKKKLSDVHRQKKSLFSTRGKKKHWQATKTLGSPPPHIKWCVPYGPQLSMHRMGACETRRT